MTIKTETNTKPLVIDGKRIYKVKIVEGDTIYNSGFSFCNRNRSSPQGGNSYIFVSIADLASRAIKK